jgi:hypothetical protein
LLQVWLLGAAAPLTPFTIPTHEKSWLRHSNSELILLGNSVCVHQIFIICNFPAREPLNVCRSGRGRDPHSLDWLWYMSMALKLQEVVLRTLTRGALRAC